MNNNTLYGAPSLLPAARTAVRTQAPTAPFAVSPWPIQTIMGHHFAQRERISGLQGHRANGFMGNGDAKVKPTVGDVRGVPPRGRPV